MKPVISVVIPVYNIEKCIAKCILSIMNQKFQNYEVIIVNDGSTDDSVTICENIINKDCRFKIINQKNSGVSAARNNGVKYSIGEYLMFIDSDDYIEQNTFEIINNNIITENSDLIMFGIVEDYNKDSKLYKSNIKGITKQMKINTDEINEEFIYLFNSTNLQTTCNKVFKADIVKNSELIFNTNMVIYEDFDFNLRYLTKCKNILIISDILYHYNLDLDIFHLGKRRKLNIAEDIHYLNESLINFTESINLNKEGNNYILNYVWSLYNLCFSKIIEKNKDISVKTRLEVLKYINNDKYYNNMYKEYGYKVKFNKVLNILMNLKIYIIAYGFIKFRLG